MTEASPQMSERLPVTDIDIELLQSREDAREVDDVRLAELKESIKEIGLIHPVRVRWKDGFYYEIIAGRHRTVACRELGWAKIPCHIVTDDDLRAELAMIDENLIRASLSPVDLVSAITRRKKIYEELHPESVAGRRRANAANAKMGRKVQDKDTPPFSKRVAELIGISQRTAQQYAALGSALHPDVESVVRDHPVLNSRTFLELVRLVPRDEQVTFARRSVESYEKSGRKTTINPIVAAWERASDRQRDEFLNQIDKLAWPSTAAP